MEFKRQETKLVSKGLDLNSPPDLMPPGFFPFLKNVRSYQEGVLQPRGGVAKVNVTPTAANNIHSLGRINDYVTNQYGRFLGIDSALYYGFTSFVEIDNRFDGQPLSFVPYRPENSNRTYMYIANNARMRKVSVAGEKPVLMGVVPPKDIPKATLKPPLYSAPDIFGSTFGWTNQGTAGALTSGARLTGVMVDGIVYDSGSSGWCSLNFVGGNLWDVAVGMRINLNGSEIVTVEEVHYIYDNNGTNSIGQIIYDVGFTGLCTIIPAFSMPGLKRNAMVRFGDGEFCTVISVTDGPGGLASFRCSTNSTKSFGTTLLGAYGGNIRCFTNGSHGSGETVTNSQLSSAVNVGIGTLAYNVPSGYVDFQAISTRPIAPDDYIHLSVKCDRPDLIVEAKLILDVDANTTGTYAATDGKGNAYVKAFRPNDFQSTITSAQTTDNARTVALQLQQQDASVIPLDTSLNPFDVFGVGGSSTPLDQAQVAESQPPVDPSISASSQLTLGETQWTEFRWRIADLIRLGSQQSRDLGKIKAIQIQLNVTAAVSIAIGSLWVGGTYGTDTGNNLTPIIYRCRYRSSTTGAHSIPGPAMRSGIQAIRQGVVLSVLASDDNQVDKIDFERLGGQNLEWHYVGTVDNVSPGIVTFTDDQLSAAVKIAPPLDIYSFVPFPVKDRPRLINVNMAGTAVAAAPGEFDTRWARGTIVKINGKVTSLYASPDTDQLLHVADTVGASGAVMEISEPVIQGQPLPVMWGPFYNTMFGCGSDKDAGAVYHTNPYNPDGAADKNRIEVTSPSERMMNGITYDGRCYAFSDQRLFAVNPNFNGINKFDFVEIPNGKGLFSPWALCAGPKIWFLASDGIYETTGGTPVKISEAISPMFPQGDKPGFNVNGIRPVKMVRNGGGGESIYLRLSYYKGYLYFDYRDEGNIPRSLVYDVDNQAWYWDNPFNTSTSGDAGGKAINCRLGETAQIDQDTITDLLLGTNFGYVMVPEGTADDGMDIFGEWRSPELDLGDPRGLKLWGDLDLYMDPDSTDVRVRAFTNDAIAGDQTYNYASAQTSLLDINAGVGIIGLNFSIRVTWNTGTQLPKFYSWGPSFVEKPENTMLRADDWTDGGYPGAKLVRGFILEADTLDVVKAVQLQGDQVSIGSPYSMDHAGQTLKAYAVNPPAIASLLRLLPTQQVIWRNFRVSYIYDKYPENAAIPTAYTDGGTMGAKFVQGVLVEGMGVDPAAQVLYDGGNLALTQPLSHPGSVLSVVPYSFPTPFIAHVMAIQPSTAIRINRVEWVYEPSPELASYWITQGTDHGIPGWQFLKDIYMPIISTDTITLTINVDGINFVYTFASTGSVYRKLYQVFAQGMFGRMLKGKLFTYSVTSPTPFRLFKKEVEVLVHPWAGGDYQVAHPFGGPSRADGARI